MPENKAQPSSGPAAARRALAQAKAKQTAALTALPSLHLLIWPTPSCLRLSLVIYHSRPGMRRTVTVLRDAEWRPQEVSERKLVEWGQRALADWLQNPTLHATSDQAYPQK